MHLTYVHFSVFLNADGRVYNCGYNGSGGLGRVAANGSPTNVNLGVVEGLPPVKQFATHGNHCIFQTTDGTIFTCGNNANGELGRVVATGSMTSPNLGEIEPEQFE